MRFNIVPALAALAVIVPNVSGRVIDGLLGRSVIDVCAQIDADLAVDVLGIAVVVGALGACSQHSHNKSHTHFRLRYLPLHRCYRGHP